MDNSQLGEAQVNAVKPPSNNMALPAQPINPTTSEPKTEVHAIAIAPIVHEEPTVTSPNLLEEAMKTVGYENDIAEQKAKSEEAQQTWVDEMTVAIAKQAAGDEDTWRKITRIGTELFKEKSVHPFSEWNVPQNVPTNPEKDVYIIMIAADNLNLPKGERPTAAQLEARIREAFSKEFDTTHGWRMSLMSVKNSIPLILNIFNKQGMLETFFRNLQSIHSTRAKLLPTLFKTAERPNRVVPPTRPYQPKLHLDPEVY